MTRSLDAHDLAYDVLGAEWDAIVDRYDTARRVEVLIDEFLGPDRIAGRRCLDAGAGLGFFAEALLDRGAAGITACDVALSQLERLRRRRPGIETRVADLMDVGAALDGRTFEIVVSSEVIEHTPDPARAVSELCRCVAPAGWLAISCPNRRWRWTLHLANLLGLRRHYQGHEHWPSPGALRDWVRSAGLEIVRAEGIHLIPWQPCPKRWLRAADRAARSWSYGIGVNLALLARRPG